MSKCLRSWPRKGGESHCLPGPGPAYWLGGCRVMLQPLRRPCSTGRSRHRHRCCTGEKGRRRAGPALAGGGDGKMGRWKEGGEAVFLIICPGEHARTPSTVLHLHCMALQRGERTEAPFYADVFCSWPITLVVWTVHHAHTVRAGVVRARAVRQRHSRTTAGMVAAPCSPRTSVQV